MERKIIKKIVLFIPLILICFSIFIKLKFNNVSFEQIIHSALTSKGGNLDILFYGIIFVFLFVFILFVFIFIFKKLYNKYLNKFKIKRVYKVIVYILIYFISIICVLKVLNIDTYIFSQFQPSNLFEKYYVDPVTANLTFPKDKKNLIYIYVESLENSFLSKENGGSDNESYIPNLEEIALKNINFSNNKKIGGAIQLNNTDWTYAALFSQTTGIPFKVNLNTNFYNSYERSFPSIYNLGDILYDNGYSNYFMMGSDANFGDRKDFLENHGNYTIYDYEYAKEEKYIDEDYFVWWGYEDKKLFEFAKDKIKEVSKKEPFNFSILTVDTHFTDGYMDDTCKNKFENNYFNAFYCSDSKINDFVNWIKKQDFYEDTTIIITGDHLTMQSNVFEFKNSYQRTIYNAFINSSVNPIKNKNRLFSSFDMFPTTLAALGVKIEDNKLGLGVNLFSKEKTLVEKLGVEKLNKEISKKSVYYNQEILNN